MVGNWPFSIRRAEQRMENDAEEGELSPCFSTCCFSRCSSTNRTPGAGYESSLWLSVRWGRVFLSARSLLFFVGNNYLKHRIKKVSTSLKGAQSRLKSLAKLFKFVVCNPCQSSPSLFLYGLLLSL